MQGKGGATGRQQQVQGSGFAMEEPRYLQGVQGTGLRVQGATGRQQQVQGSGFAMEEQWYQRGGSGSSGFRAQGEDDSHAVCGGPCEGGEPYA